MPRFQQEQLGQFVRARRDRLAPGDVGLPSGPRRRAPGLRRDEVASLANMSTDYYERIEQGRGPQPSATMLGAVARALRLTIPERDHLYVLAGHPVPEPFVSLGYADPGLMTVLDVLAPSVPAMIADDLHYVVGQNPLNVALLGQLVGEPGLRSNFLWHWFMDPAYARLYEPNDVEQLGRSYVSGLRAAIARRPDDRAAIDLLNELRTHSDQFEGMWALNEVTAPSSTRKVLAHPVVGVLDCECDVVISPPSQQRMVLFRGTPGTVTGERLSLLRVLGTQDLARDPAQ
ncbi:helix-turn-helix transcriptional regulator [Rhodococcus ruber]|uniref:Helix-turn-helix transcriptional regulator n=1 Tax=Rhodococcus ruber TaxID=1830 RepID=A0ABT4MH45_9NOCA|nr:helix-turn-helix transcriptional regulator [Rhodococcus ruber]MCZ4519365.1 helix-turn-helix transcriptional regulator [Rhodococcus ruber]